MFRVEKLMFVPMATSCCDGKIELADSKYVEMIRKVEREKAFYFSYDMDLTKNMQRILREVQGND